MLHTVFYRVEDTRKLADPRQEVEVTATEISVLKALIAQQHQQQNPTKKGQYLTFLWYYKSYVKDTVYAETLKNDYCFKVDSRMKSSVAKLCSVGQ